MDRQEVECRELCQRLGFEVGEVFIDNDLSATTGVVRPAFERLLASSPEAIVCWHSDRFIRIMSDLERAIKLGVNIYAVHTGNLDLSTFGGRMVARIVTAVAQHEGEQKAARQRAAHRQRAAQGRPFWSVIPFGYHKDGTLDGREAEALRRAYNGLLEGVPVHQLNQRLNREGFLTRGGKKWTPAGVRRLLLAERNAGISTHDGAEVGEGTWAKVVDLDTFRAAQVILNSPSRKLWKAPAGRKPTALLSAIAYCDVCGDPVRAWRSPGRSVYVCRVNGCCTAPIEQLDSMVLRAVVGALGDEQVRRYWLDALAENGPQNGTQSLARAAVLQGRMEEAAHGYATGVITMAQLGQINEELRKELAEVETELEASKRGFRVADLLVDPELIWSKLDDMDLMDMRALVGEMVEEVRIKPRGKAGNHIPFGRDYLVLTMKGEGPAQPKLDGADLDR